MKYEKLYIHTHNEIPDSNGSFLFSWQFLAQAEQRGIRGSGMCRPCQKYARAYCAAKSISIAGINVFKMSQTDLGLNERDAYVLVAVSVTLCVTLCETSNALFSLLCEFETRPSILPKVESTAVIATLLRIIQQLCVCLCLCFSHVYVRLLMCV